MTNKSDSTLRDPTLVLQLKIGEVFTKEQSDILMDYLKIIIATERVSAVREVLERLEWDIEKSPTRPSNLSSLGPIAAWASGQIGVKNIVRALIDQEQTKLGKEQGK